eukprot:UN23514
MGHQDTLKFVNRVIQALNLKYIDLLVCSWVGGSWRENQNFAQDKMLRRDTWKAMERLKNEGLTKSIGLENYNKHF